MIVRAVPERSYGAALLYFTGSKAHNIALRGLANEHGWKLNEYGLFAGKRRIAGVSEAAIYGSSVLRSSSRNCARTAARYRPPRQTGCRIV